MAVLITDIYDSQAVAARRTQDPSNAMGFVGKAFFPNRKKLGLSLKWIKTHKGLNAILKGFFQAVLNWLLVLSKKVMRKSLKSSVTSTTKKRKSVTRNN